MSDFPTHVLRADLHTFTGYSSARTSFAGPPARIWLNANEAAEPNSVDPTGAARRYPPPQPEHLRTALADYLSTDPQHILLSRGSDEAIDVLIRALCPPGAHTGIVLCSPTFGMYAVSARIHGVPVHDVPQNDTGHTFEHDLAAVAAAVHTHDARIVFLSSPGNPTGSVIDRPALDALLTELAGTAVVVLDEAYGEFVDHQPTHTDPRATRITDVPTRGNLAVLRTMSKAHGLAGARIGALVGHPELIEALRRVQAPYPLAEPATQMALAALQPDALRHTTTRVSNTVRRRADLSAVLTTHPRVRAVYASHGNFILTRCVDPAAVMTDLRLAEIAVRDMRHLPGLNDAIRVSVGTAEEINCVAQAIATTTPPHDPMERSL